VALALMVLGIPILDVAIVMINRVRRGQHPLHYDTTHLHHRLRATGLTPRQICYLFYGFTSFFGILALNLLHLFKLIGIGLVVVIMLAVIVWIDYRQRQRGTPIELNGPEPDNSSGTGEPGPQVPFPDEKNDFVRTTNYPLNQPKPDVTGKSSDARAFL
jgi:UDP-GlcNAc:undecaprenyl-phosphate/decaprenyl-phosphate GlcNAc-1-phosphate transferase